MDVATIDAPAGGDSTAIANGTPANLPDSFSAARDAARVLSEHRWRRDNPEQTAATGAQPAAEPQPDTAEPAENAAPATEQPSGEVETEAQPEPAVELPPIEPPRSWTADHKERFASLPRDTQEYIAQREQDRERELRRSQNEHADKLKGLTAKEQQAEDARKQYEQALPALLQTLQESYQGQWSHIKTMADVQKLAEEDPFQYSKWDAHQKQIASVQQEWTRTQQRQQQEFAQKWNEFASKEDAAFADAVPEMKDATKSRALMDGARNRLLELGFKEDELGKLWDGQASVSLRDHRIQQLIADSARLREARKTSAQPAKKPLPQVVKPGTSGAREDTASLEIRALQKAFDENPNPKNAGLLKAAQRAQAARRPG